MLDNSLGEADYYDERDYIGILRRLVIYAIDIFVLLMLGVAVGIPITITAVLEILPLDPGITFWLVYLLAIWTYLAPIKRTRFGTLGYLICGVRIVSATGAPPSLLVMTTRMVLWIANPFNTITDLCWIGLDSERQILRDCYLGNYLVNRNAQPIGSGPVHLTRYFAMGFAMAYPRVCRGKLGS
ncbi:RDD family protein [Blastopirellula sp. JC732]|uniref:RDD family protein n=1 Tax=Blastopirellula sediminis TaxID=2894196 RepID=A0A9X1MLR9_9BACT|nr:RDD family protein [Blastopirellula sediminis]MCC9607319.1 RDD family protein [Blastopirellula sediminis]MCC9629388.1 RDD family protein [Blastopirellula sediminis]